MLLGSKNRVVRALRHDLPGRHPPGGAANRAAALQDSGGEAGGALEQLQSIENLAQTPVKQLGKDVETHYMA